METVAPAIMFLAVEKILDAELNLLAVWRTQEFPAAQSKILSFRIPNPFQCQKLLRLLERLEYDGLTYAPDAEL